MKIAVTFVSGDKEVTHFQNEFTDDEWTQLGLTIEGSIGNFDVSYAASYLDREVDGSFDYSDYSYWYDTAYTTGYYADLHFANSGDRAVLHLICLFLIISILVMPELESWVALISPMMTATKRLVMS